MDIESQLKAFILSRFSSVREFSQKIDMPYSTLDSIFKRGIANASITNIIRICEALSISADELAGGRIVSRIPDSITPDESNLINQYRSLNEQGKEYIRQTMFMAVVTYKKTDSVPGLEDCEEA